MSNATNTKASEANEPAVVITAWHEGLFSDMETGRSQKGAFAKLLDARLTTRYAAKMPTLAQWDEDRDALKALGKKRGLSEFYNYHLMTYSQAVQAKYGAAPVSMSEDSKRKRRDRIAEISPKAVKVFDDVYAEFKAAGCPDYVCEARAAKAALAQKGKKVQDSAGAPAGNKNASADMTIEQLVARDFFGFLDAIASITLAQADSDVRYRAIAKGLADLGDQLRLLMKPREVAAAPKVEAPKVEAPKVEAPTPAPGVETPVPASAEALAALLAKFSPEQLSAMGAAALAGTVATPAKPKRTRKTA